MICVNTHYTPERMAAARQAKRKLDLPPDSPGNTLSTGQTFVTAQEELEPLVPPTEADAVTLVDVGEVSSPNKLMKWKRQTERLQADAVHFKKSRTLHVKPKYRNEDTSKSHTVSGRAARAEARELRKGGVDESDWAQDDAEASKALLELAHGSSDLLAHETLQGAGDSRESSQAGSHDSSSQHDQAMAAAWARLHSADTDMGASSPGNLAADWRSAAQVPDAASPTYATAADRKRSSAEPAEHPVALSEQAGRASAQPVQSPQPSASAEPAGQRSEVPSPTSPSCAAAQTAQDVGSTPSSAKQKHAVVGNSPLHAKSHSAGPQPYTRPVTRASAKTPQSATRGMSKVILKSPQPTKLSASKADVAGEAELASSPEHRERPALTPVLASLKKVARQTEKASASSAQFHQQPMAKAGQSTSHEHSMQQDADALDAKAIKMAMQRLADNEARQRQADEALLRGTPSTQLLQVPMWATSLSPDQPQPTGKRLQGTLTIPNNCSVRLMRRVFARAVQVQPSCIQLVVSGSRALVEDFDKGQEVLISRYDLQGNPEGLQVQLDLQQGHAQVQAVIDQEVSLVKHNLLATRLTDRPNAPAPGPSEQALTPNRRHSVAAVLESAGWGATSPDKRVTPPQKAAQAASRHLADYEAMLPAQPQPARAVSLASPGRRRVGKWDEVETDTLIRKMEAGHSWAKMRDDWPSLNFAARSAVDLKDKWRNLEDAVLKGKIMRGTQLTAEQRDRILRCHRKYRSMLANTPGDEQNSTRQSGGSNRLSQTRGKSSENAPPLDQS